MNKLQQRCEAIYAKFAAYTMIDERVYVANLKRAFFAKDVPGAVVECGTWKGGMIAGIAELLGPDRQYFLFDSYEGLPPAGPEDGEQAQIWQASPDGEFYFDNCTAAMSDAEEAMALTGVPDVTITKGWFSDTLPSVDVSGGIAVLRLDGDFYDSTMDCLNHLYPQVASEGLIVFDDYFTWDGCTLAVHDYLSTHRLTQRIRSDDGIAHIIKQRATPVYGV